MENNTSIWKIEDSVHGVQKIRNIGSSYFKLYATFLRHGNTVLHTDWSFI